MKVTRIYESPRVTKPYSEEQWDRIESLGHAIDADLIKQDVRLTMGGEPTFVSIDDPDGPEWNFTAVSHKETRSLRRPDQAAAEASSRPEHLLHYGQGKWYPGEPLPRWALAAYWRKDGVPIWKDDSLIADESKDYGLDAKDAQGLCSRASRTVVGADPKYMLPGLRGCFLLHLERAAPAVKCHARKIESQRQIGARTHRATFSKRAWTKSSAMRCRSSGLRMELNSAGCRAHGSCAMTICFGSSRAIHRWVCACRWIPFRGLRKKIIRPYWQQDPSRPRCRRCRKNFHIARIRNRTGNDSSVAAARHCRAGYGPGQRPQSLGQLETEMQLPDLPGSNPNRRPVQGESAPWIVRTALCVEPRDGRLARVHAAGRDDRGLP